MADKYKFWHSDSLPFGLEVKEDGLHKDGRWITHSTITQHLGNIYKPPLVDDGESRRHVIERLTPADVSHEFENNDLVKKEWSKAINIALQVIKSPKYLVAEQVHYENLVDNRSLAKGQFGEIDTKHNSLIVAKVREVILIEEAKAAGIDLTEYTSPAQIRLASAILMTSKAAVESPRYLSKHDVADGTTLPAPSAANLEKLRLEAVERAGK